MFSLAMRFLATTATLAFALSLSLPVARRPVLLAGDGRQLAALQHCGEKCGVETHQRADAAVRITFRAASLSLLD